MASPDYDPVFPSSVAADDKIRTFWSTFFETSDDPSKNDDWVNYFLPDALLVMGPTTAKGTEGMSFFLPFLLQIRHVRTGMWEKVGARKHKPLKVFESTFGSGTQYMLHGDVDYELKTGERQSISWAAHAVIEDVEGQLRFSYYRVYLQR
ncbi:hypothetical protein BJ170DRAFT_693661 [Xylariales sp. AK1849]|nr:hypothetical protein BJ170DRAFT_693661 [Xylariales sp. AK1849]